mgnify:CR=1 FL=1
MPAPIAVNPLEALAAVTGKIKQGTVEWIDLESAAGRYLAEPLHGASRSAGQPADPPGILRSSCDGYALPDGCGAGDRLSLREELADLAAQPAAPLIRKFPMPKPKASWPTTGS